MTPYRERDGRNLALDLLEQTGAFDNVYLSGLPEDHGLAAGESRVAVIEPSETSAGSPWDDAGGDVLFTCRLQITILARHNDPQLRDELAERLLTIAAAALGGVSLGGANVPSRTAPRSWTWQKAVPPERRIAAVFEYQYLVDGWPGLNTND